MSWISSTTAVMMNVIKERMEEERQNEVYIFSILRCMVKISSCTSIGARYSSIATTQCCRIFLREVSAKEMCKMFFYCYHTGL